MFEFHRDQAGEVRGSPGDVFQLLDDPRRLGAHMERRSWRMLWGRFSLTIGELRGRSVGSRIVLNGRIAGIRLHLEEVITVREAPHRKRWRTVGAPRLLLIGAYDLGFALHGGSVGSTLVVDIRYDLPATRLPRRLRVALVSYYAGWCLRRMVEDAQAAFAVAAK